MTTRLLLTVLRPIRARIRAIRHASARMWFLTLLALGLTLLGYIGTEAWTCGGNLVGWDWMLITGGATFLITIVISLQAEKRLTQCLERLAMRGVLRGGHSAVVDTRAALQALATRAARRWAKGILIAEVGAMVAAQIVVPAFISEGIIFFSDGVLIGFLRAAGADDLGVGWEQVALFIVGGVCGYLTGLRFGTFITYGRLASILDRTEAHWVLKPGHPDGAGGLKPVGEFYQFQAQILGAPLLWLASWAILASIWPGNKLPSGEQCLHRLDYEPWQGPLLVLWLIVAVVMVTSFVVPVRQFHVRMSSKKKRILASEGRRLRETIAKTAPDPETGLDPDYVAHLHFMRIAEERLASLENAAVWPTSLGLTTTVVVRYVVLAAGPVLIKEFLGAWATDQPALKVIFRFAGKLFD